MSWALWILVALIIIYAWYGFMPEWRWGKTLVSVRLRRRIADHFFLLIILVARIYYEIKQQNFSIELMALLILSGLVIWQGLSYPKWRLKKEGFVFGGRYWSYDAIAAMRLSEDGILVLTLQNGRNLVLPVAKIEDLEKSAAFFTSEEVLNHLLQKGEK